jgi:hypothetical protein
MSKHVMTPSRRAALRKAQLVSARKRRRHGLGYDAKRGASQAVGLMMAGARLHTTARARRH